MSVLGYWLVNVDSGKAAGHSAIIWTGAPSPSSKLNLSKATLAALGASSSDKIASYYMGGDPKNLQSELYKALGALNVSADQIPVLPDHGTPQQVLGKNFIKALNFDVLAPIGTTPSQVYQSTLPVSQSLTDILSGGNWLQLIVRGLELVVGIAFVFLALQAVSGTGGQGLPVQTVRRYVKYAR